MISIRIVSFSFKYLFLFRKNKGSGKMPAKSMHILEKKIFSGISKPYTSLLSLI